MTHEIIIAGFGGQGVLSMGQLLVRAGLNEGKEAVSYTHLDVYKRQGLGSIQPAQSDYFQMTKGGGHGDYKLIVFAPDSVQEAVDLTYSAFDTADKYRTPVVILGDGMIGQMMEPVEMPEEIAELPEKPWATTGCAKGERRIINLSLIHI